MPVMKMQHDKDPKTDIIDKLGDLSDFDVMDNRALLAIYVRPKKTAGGIMLTDKYVDGDNFQGKACLVVKAGPHAYSPEPGSLFETSDINVGDWVIVRASDGMNISIRGVECKIIRDDVTMMRIPQPDEIW